MNATPPCFAPRTDFIPSPERNARAAPSETVWSAAVIAPCPCVSAVWFASAVRCRSRAVCHDFRCSACVGGIFSYALRRSFSSFRNSSSRRRCSSRSSVDWRRSESRHQRTSTFAARAESSRPSSSIAPTLSAGRPTTRMRASERDFSAFHWAGSWFSPARAPTAPTSASTSAITSASRLLDTRGPMGVRSSGGGRGRS